MTRHYLLLFFLSYLCSLSSSIPFPAHQQNLLTSLFGPDYNPLFIPVKNESVSQEVFLEATLQKIIDVDLDKGIFTTLVWLDMHWEDDYLKWDPEEYGGVDRLHLPPSRVWTPDIFLFNDITGHFEDDLKRDNPFLVVDSDGHVRWIPPLVLKTMCDFTGNNQETQQCELKFGSWVYNANQLDLISKISSMDLEGYTAHPVWDLESASVERHETKYECCPESFVDMSYAIRFHEKSVWSFI
eukprot:GFUD01113885.1.p1 GENE.GFUD01113885.1~~GFUD01113885.1.p1  ORF type:complete len:241 (-),score=65.47 GFUD01113885.1:93-815(-)